MEPLHPWGPMAILWQGRPDLPSMERARSRTVIPVGYSNVEDPDIVVSVIIEGGGTGSESAVPVAGSVFNSYYYE